MDAPQSRILIPSCLSKLLSKVWSWSILVAARADWDGLIFPKDCVPRASRSCGCSYCRCSSRPWSNACNTSWMIWICSFWCFWNSPLGRFLLRMPVFCIRAAVGGYNCCAGRCVLMLVLLMSTNASRVIRACGPFSTDNNRANRVFMTNVLVLFFFISTPNLTSWAWPGLDAWE